jgi:hypothetical protein
MATFQHGLKKHSNHQRGNETEKKVPRQIGGGYNSWPHDADYVAERLQAYSVLTDRHDQLPQVSIVAEPVQGQTPVI